MWCVSNEGGGVVACFLPCVVVCIDLSHLDVGIMAGVLATLDCNG